MEKKDSALKSSDDEKYSYKKKIDILTEKLDTIKKDALNVDTDMNGSPDSIERLKNEINQLKSDLEIASSGKINVEKVCQELNENLETTKLKLSSTKEKLTVLRLAFKKSNNSNDPQLHIQKVQDIWDSIGLKSEQREKFRKQIETCLEDTCQRIQKDAIEMKKSIQDEIKYQEINLVEIYKSLGMTENIGVIDHIRTKGHKLSNHLSTIENYLNDVMPKYNAAVDRKNKIAEETENILRSLDLDTNDVSQNLRNVLKSKARRGKKRERPLDRSHSQSGRSVKERRAKMRDVEELVRALEPSNRNTNVDNLSTNKEQTNDSHEIEGANRISEKFLNDCDDDLRQLRMLKSKKLGDNSCIRENSRKLVIDMNIREKEILSLCVHSIKKRRKTMPEWWEPKVSERVCRTIMSKNGILDARLSFSRHLSLIDECLQSIATGRKLLSEELKREVEQAHKTLLSAVECDNQANEEYESFYNALFRLPPLSKDHIGACIDEINVLISTAEAMTQSEVEALAVIWEALNVTSTERGRLWSEVEESINKIQAKTESPFDAVRQACTTDIEEWVLVAIREATKLHRLLNIRLFKLTKIHNEVLRLGRRQDLKSKILSLDAEIRIVSSKITDFEEKTGKKKRLLTKKTNSSNLLKEERFRKQMQANYSSKLQNLGKLLLEWEKKEGKVFDATLLTEDIRVLIDNVHDYHNWVDEKTAFMHLGTTKKIRRVVTDENTKPTNESTNGDDINEKNIVQGRQIQIKKKRELIRARRTFSPNRRNNIDGTKYRARPSAIASSPNKIAGIRTKTFDYSSKMNHDTSRGRRTAPKVTFESQSTRDTTSEKHKQNDLLKKRHTKSPPRIKTSPLKNVNTSPEKRDSEILPFGHILSNTPHSKENQRSKF